MLIKAALPGFLSHLRTKFHPIHGLKMNATTWTAPNVWIFMAQLVEYRSANPETMGSNPVEVPKFFSGSFVIA